MPLSPYIVGVGGFASDTGKTTLVCELLRALPGWEAIKITRGHYRSCGKDAHACCVSHLLRDEPLALSGRAETYAPGKDTGRYWDAGASNVHWVVVTQSQVEQGVKAALARVRAAGVVIEGTSFWQFVPPRLALLAANVDNQTMKASARRAWAQTDGLYLGEPEAATRQRFEAWLARQVSITNGRIPPYYTRADVPQLVARILA
jgi:molybdopterin-guanine dinucleotide biosynthesis protein